jgi:hypothetical protein
MLVALSRSWGCVFRPAWQSRVGVPRLSVNWLRRQRPAASALFRLAGAQALSDGRDGEASDRA